MFMIPKPKVGWELGFVNSQEPQKTEEQNWAGHLGHSPLNSESPKLETGFSNLIRQEVGWSRGEEGCCKILKGVKL